MTDSDPVARLLQRLTILLFVASCGRADVGQGNTRSLVACVNRPVDTALGKVDAPLMSGTLYLRARDSALVGTEYYCIVRPLPPRTP